MGGLSIRFGVCLLFSYLQMDLRLIAAANANSNAVLTMPSNSLLLPLFLSANLSTSSSNIRSSLHASGTNPYPSARMRLYDDLLRNGYYTTRLWIGTPPQKFTLIVDSGSTVTYVPCSTCTQCGLHQDPKFQPASSSTYKPLECNMDCNCDISRAQCIYERQYAEMSSSSGVLGDDIISFGNQSGLAPQRAVFGCENMETGDLYSQLADGIMGLGRGDLSIVDQLVGKGAISDSFSLCYGGMDVGGGAMVLGSISPPPEMVFTSSDPARSPYYNIDLKEMLVAGKRLPLKPTVFNGKHGTVLDSGTTYAYLPEPAFSAFKYAIVKELHSLKQIKGPDPNYKDICFSGVGNHANQLSDIFPMVGMVFSNGQKLLLSPENYLFRHSKEPSAYCLGVFQNGKDPTTLLGGIIVRNTLVVYDRENSKIGFWKTNCSELWDTLHSSVVPPPLLSNENNSSTAETLLASPPHEQPHNLLPAETQIGHIAFEMLLSINCSEMNLLMDESSIFVSEELGSKNMQVHLLNVSSRGNTCLIFWAVFPSGAADHIANATALHIITDVAEGHLRLPETLGSYKLIRWTIFPPDKQTLLQRHNLAMLFSVAILVFAALATASAVWFFTWRHRRQLTNSYKPVDGVQFQLREQELHPLQ